MKNYRVHPTTHWLISTQVLRSPFFALSFGVYVATVAGFARPAGVSSGVAREKFNRMTGGGADGGN